MKTLRPFIVAATIIGSILTAAFAAESFSVLLQKGIFAEETEGNLDAAIQIYQQITTEAAAQRAIAAQAQYRLGVCHQKKGNKEQAIGALNELLRQFPTETTLGQKARESLAALGQLPSSQITLRELPLSINEGHAISADGRFLAYCAKDEGPVLIQELATGKSWTAIEKYADRVVFSPDGRSLAYQQSGAIHIAKIDGSEAKVICPKEKKVGALYDWTPDRAALLIGTWGAENGTSLGMVDLATGTLQVIKESPLKENVVPVRAKFSPDGRLLAYWSQYSIPQRTQIVIRDHATGTETSFTDKELVEFVGWQPNGGRLLFTSNRSGSTGLWAVTVRDGQPTGEPELLKANIYAYRFPPCAIGLTRDGSLLFTEKRSFKDIYLATANFETGDLLTQPHRVATRFEGEQSIPVWSRDGQRLMYAVQFGQKRYVAITMGTGEQKEYPVWESFVSWLRNYAWSNDSTYLLVASSRAEIGLGIHRYELATGAIETLVKNTSPAKGISRPWTCQPRIAPDGNSFFYNRRDFFKGADGNTDWKDCIIRYDLRSGKEEVAFASPEKLQVWWPFELAPDGERLALVVSEQFKTEDFVVSLKVRKVSGGESQEILRLAPRESVSSLAWTPDGKRLVFTKGDNDRDAPVGKASSLWSIAAEGGLPTEIKFDLPDIRDLALHPDGRQIAFRAGPGGQTKLWVLEGLTAKPAASAAQTSGN